MWLNLGGGGVAACSYWWKDEDTPASLCVWGGGRLLFNQRRRGSSSLEGACVFVWIKMDVREGCTRVRCGDGREINGLVKGTHKFIA